MEKNRLYNDLAWLWPLWEANEDYNQETEYFSELIKQYARINVKTLLDVGCGGGKHAFHFKRQFSVTGIDISEAMLSQAKKLNPECTFHSKDMRNFDLKTEFDAVFLNDSIAYMTSGKDFNKVFKNAYRNLITGGVMICVAETHKENFTQNQTSVSTSKVEDVEVTFIENSYDPDPEDTTYEATFIYMIRKHGKLQIEHDSHIVGLFPLDTWRETIKENGFDLYEVEWKIDKVVYPLFVGIKS